ncbi:DUF4019 domain-containing protein [Mesoterricola sediminis]|uniref:Uncharacterized protein n=1 Tax=Mesoterricola sediminis TaxID=2927980 RepID=A0AA48H8N5_9BACT|nr:DUF4019 domain-containing protein [Mesoterricola sediminis]BDU77968.1 hypothetical protein METESE_29260 [Mesoterricola sediminis]
MRCPTCEALNLDESPTCFNCGSPLQPGRTPYASPDAPVGEPPRRGFRAKWLLWGCGGALALLLLLLGSCVLFVKGGLAASERTFAPAVDAYLAHVRAGDYAGAYREFGEPMHKVVKEADYIALETGFQEKLGPLLTKKPQAFQTGVDGQGTWGRIAYTCDFAKGPGTLLVSLRKADGVWKIVELRYDSPVFLEYLKSRKAS